MRVWLRRTPQDRWKEYEKYCEINSKDFYSSGIIASAHLIMEKLSYPQKGDILKHKKMSCKEAWECGIKGPGHSGMSAAAVAITIFNFSPRGEEFRKWCKKEDIVMVDWDGE